VPVQVRHVLLGQRHLRCAQQHGRLLAGQRQVGRTDLDDPAFRAQPRDPHRRGSPPGEHQAATGRHMIGQHRQRGPALDVAQQVHVIQHQHHRHGHRREGQAQPRHHRPGHRTRRGGQRVEHPLTNRLDRIQRLGYITEQHLRVVVLLIDLHPGERLPVVLGPLRQQCRLPVTRRCDHRHDRPGAPLHQLVDQ